MSTPLSAEWKKTACIICSLNCGLEVQTEGGRIVKARGDKDHPTSQGYVCEKSQRMDFYQNGADRITSPKRRRVDGSYEDIDWATAIREIAEKFAAVKAKHGGASILYYGGGSQGNHLGGTYADSTIKALGIVYRSNALAQEKTGEAWVQGKMMGAGVHGDFEHAEVSVFLGKNPFQSHGFARTRVILREIQKDPNRSMIVIDPRRSETAEMADYHLAVRPGTDAWCLTALAAIIVQEGLVAKEWLAEHTTGYDRVAEALKRISIVDYARTCGVDLALLRQVAERIARAKSVSMIEDLGVQMNLHSTLNSYLNRLVWLLTGHYARPGTNNAFVPMLNLSSSTRESAEKAGQSTGGVGNAGKLRPGSHSPVTGAKVIMGLIPCNVIPDEILTDHPSRFRAMFIESSNPVHSLADSQRMRQALRALDVSVVIDVAMTETARQADYVLPASSQFEKAEATFFNLEFPRNGFQLRQPLFASRPGTLTEAEMHARLIEALGELDASHYRFLRQAARWGRTAFGLAFAWKTSRDRKVARYAPVVLYRTLGETLPTSFAPAASLWGISQLFVRGHPAAAARAGFGGSALAAGNKLFDAILTKPSGVIYSVSEYADSWSAVRLPDHKINLCVEEMLKELAVLDSKLPHQDADYPFVLSAGERRSDTSNTSIRDAAWHRRGTFGTLRMHPADAEKIGCKEGDWVSMTTRRGNAQAVVEMGDDLQRGHVSLPNGHGLDYTAADGTEMHKGVSLNELTDTESRDPFAGTPWHKYVPVRIERRVVTQEATA
ncbi:molybdopterin-dependent oxidoreductase [Sphaerotilus sp.]|uniref:molybdopterin-dependent oxidoreductase n=1 Tax=Sphaerotilus sp. TaxID=2093942 RepID=UPI00286DE8CD|nr:molybdopterin-dependent oxidoreductase [Sphaerotilus sp.]